MGKLVMLRGIPASGKSTWIKDNNYEKYTISSDDVRNKFFGDKEYDSKDNVAIWGFIKGFVTLSLDSGGLVIIDGTNIQSFSLKQFEKIASRCGATVDIVNFDIDLDVCLDRNSKRNGRDRVPDEVIKRMYSEKQNNSIPASFNCYEHHEYKIDTTYSRLRGVN